MRGMETIRWERAAQKGKRIQRGKYGVWKTLREKEGGERKERLNERDSDYLMKEVTKQFSYVVDAFTSSVGINCTLLFTTNILAVSVLYKI